MTTFLQIEYHQSSKEKTQSTVFFRKDRFEGRDDFLAGSFLFSLYYKFILSEETPHDKDLVTKGIHVIFNLTIFQQLLINSFLQEKTMSFSIISELMCKYVHFDTWRNTV